MADYGFDYFLNRTNILNEMARPVSIFTTGGRENLRSIQDVYKTLITKGEKYFGPGNATAGSRQKFAYDFILSSLIDELGIDEDTLKYARSLFPNETSALTYLRMATVKTVQDNPEISNSPEFLQSLLDDDSMDRHYTITKMRGSNRARGLETEISNVLDIDRMSFVELNKASQPIRREINRGMAGRNISRGRVGERSKFNKIEQSSDVEEYNPNINFAYLIVDGIDSLLESQTDYLKSIKSGMMDMDELEDSAKILVKSPSAKGDLTVLKDLYNKTIEAGTGVSSDEFDAYITKLSSMKGMTPERASIFKLLQTEIQELTNQEGLDDIFPTKAGLHTDFEGYDQDVIQRILDTPEKKDLFSKWYQTNNTWRTHQNEKLENLHLRQLMNIQFFQKRGIEDIKNPTPDQELNLDALMQQKEKYEKMIADITDPSRKNAMQNYINSLEDQIKQAQSQEEDEEIISYMTEQISKDRFTPNGKFVDRGFKKSINSFHRMMKNL